MEASQGHYSTAVMNSQPLREALEPPRLLKSHAIAESRPHCQQCGKALRQVTNDDGPPVDIGFILILPNGRSIRICTEHNRGLS